MAAVETIPLIDAEKVLARWAAAGGPSDEEVIQFADDAIALLSDNDQASRFADNVKQVGTWANQIDASFDRVSRSFDQMVARYGADFPGFSNYNVEWKGFFARWISHLSLSRDVASENVTLLRRFDHVFLDMVEHIETDQDRLDVIVELQQFIDEKHSDRSTEMSQGFLLLRRDIDAFVPRLNRFIAERGVELAAAAKQLQLDISGLQSEIEVLDGQIKAATIALATSGALLFLIGLIVAGSVLASFQARRNAKANELLAKQNELAEVNRKQEALAHLQSEFDGLKPDIALISERLVLFAEIWSSVRSQTVQFQGHLRGGMEAVTNMRFRREVRLAREVCEPLQAGLERYAIELVNRNK